MTNLQVGDKVRVKGERRKKGEIASFGKTPKGIDFAFVYIKEALHCIPLDKLEAVRKT